jgi:RNA polymerase sigma-70 factor (ECF subfamily)
MNFESADDSSPTADAETRLRVLYDSWARAVLAYALRRTQTRADAEDVLIETFTVCWRRINDVPDGDAALAWLYAVASRVLANHRRGETRRLRLVARVATDRSAMKRVESANDSVLAEAMAQLKADEAEILRLAAWEELRPAEIAVVLGCSPNAAAVRLHRARRALRNAFVALQDLDVRSDTKVMRRRGPHPHTEQER